MEIIVGLPLITYFNLFNEFTELEYKRCNTYLEFYHVVKGVNLVYFSCYISITGRKCNVAWI